MPLSLRSLVCLLSLLVAAAGTAQAQTPEPEATNAAATRHHWQWAASLNIDSDYRFRGVSLSDEKPAAQVGLSFDHTSGWYGGASLGAATLEPGERRPLLLAYAGHAQELPGQGLSWELGSVGAFFGGGSSYNYVEVYAGLSGQHWSTRLYYSPDYFGRDWPSVYAEFNASWPLGESWRAFMHVGVLKRLQGDASGSSTREDARFGLSLGFEPLQWQLAWVGASRNYTQSYGHRRNTVVLSLSAFF